MFLIDVINRKKIKAAENQCRHSNLFWRDYIGYHRILLSLGFTETNPKDHYGRLRRVDFTPFEQANDLPKAFVRSTAVMPFFATFTENCHWQDNAKQN